MMIDRTTPSGIEYSVEYKTEDAAARRLAAIKWWAEYSAHQQYLEQVWGRNSEHVARNEE